MRIDAETTCTSWTVVNVANNMILRDVLWVDDDTLQFGQAEMPLRMDLFTGRVVQQVHQCARITIIEGLSLVEVSFGRVPEIPPEVHNRKPIDAERCMAAVRAMCGDSS